MSHLATRQPLGNNAQSGENTLSAWRGVITPVIETLQRMAGTTEDEFLQIGSQMQSLYLRSSEVSRMSNQLVEVVSGEAVQSLTGRLRHMMTEMEIYLTDARKRSNDSCSTLERIQDLLGELSEPLVGFQKMNKALRMLSISTKIESSRLGDMGSGFVNLAMDVEKLSHQVNDKSAAILAHRQMLATMINSNLTSVRSSETDQDGKVASSLKSIYSSLQELTSVNERCTIFGATVSTISADVSCNISEVVSSLQTHDMTRQQVEHIVEALKRLNSDLSDSETAIADENRSLALIIESGNVCELQEAQLRFASAELYTAVRIIIDNLRDAANKQSLMADETRNVAGMADSSGTSFVDIMLQGMIEITDALTSCAWADQNMLETMKKVAQTIGEIASFVTDIEAIGSEIELIALNAQIKSVHTGSEGAALGVLAEAIKRLSDQALHLTNSVVAILKHINSATGHLSLDAANEGKQLSSRIYMLQGEVAEIMRSLTDTNTELSSILSSLRDQVTSLADDVEKATSGIDVHEQTKMMSDGVLEVLEQIVAQARRIVPASSEFKENLRHMEQRYTMESERHIHEALARKLSGQSSVSIISEDKNSFDESEFGNNVELF